MNMRTDPLDPGTRHGGFTDRKAALIFSDNTHSFERRSAQLETDPAALRSGIKVIRGLDKAFGNRRRVRKSSVFRKGGREIRPSGPLRSVPQCFLAYMVHDIVRRSVGGRAGPRPVRRRAVV